MEITTIGIDLAKHVFQVHGVDADGGVAVRRKLRRSEVIGFFSKLAPTVVGMEACATSHYWARKLGALGHTVRLIPPAYVKPFLKRQKNDAAVSRPSMRFVPLKSAEQQGVLVLPGHAIFSSGSGRYWPTRSERTWRSSASSRSLAEPAWRP